MFARLCRALIVGSLLAVPSASFCQADSTSKKSDDKLTAKAPLHKPISPIKKSETKTDALKKKTAECLLKERVVRDTDAPNGGGISPIIIGPTNDKVRPTVLIC